MVELDLTNQRIVVFQTDRLQVTQWRLEDLNDLHTLCADADVMRFISSTDAESLEETRTRLHKYIRAQRSGELTKWRVADQSGTTIGRAGFEPFRDGYEIGYSLAKPMWGQGLGSELAAALSKWFSRYHSRTALYALAATENARSHRILDNIGMSAAGKEWHNGLEMTVYMTGDISHSH